MQLPVLILTMLLFYYPNILPENSVARPLTGNDISAKVLVSNLSNPWEILWGPDDFIWITEKKGRISRVNPATGEVTPMFTEQAVVSRVYRLRYTFPKFNFTLLIALGKN
jgi:glucose/arabinose dehydrogenase